MRLSGRLIYGGDERMVHAHLALTELRKMGIQRESGDSQEAERPPMEYDVWDYGYTARSITAWVFARSRRGVTFRRVLGRVRGFLRSTPTDRSKAQMVGSGYAALA